MERTCLAWLDDKNGESRARRRDTHSCHYWRRKGGQDGTGSSTSTDNNGEITATTTPTPTPRNSSSNTKQQRQRRQQHHHHVIKSNTPNSDHKGNNNNNNESTEGVEGFRYLILPPTRPEQLQRKQPPVLGGCFRRLRSNLAILASASLRWYKPPRPPCLAFADCPTTRPCALPWEPLSPHSALGADEGRLDFLRRQKRETSWSSWHN